eukprot:5733488-Pyramimonas_sp.AAC.1
MTDQSDAGSVGARTRRHYYQSHAPIVREASWFCLWMAERGIFERIFEGIFEGFYGNIFEWNIPKKDWRSGEGNRSSPQMGGESNSSVVADINVLIWVRAGASQWRADDVAVAALPAQAEALLPHA